MFSRIYSIGLERAPWIPYVKYLKTDYRQKYLLLNKLFF